MQNDRAYLEFALAYSFQYEKMMYKFFARMDKLCSFLLLLGGVSVVANELPPALLGLFVSAVSFFQLVYQPSAKATTGKSQHQKLAALFLRRHELSDDELRQACNNPDHTDEIGLLAHPARLAAYIMLGWSCEQERPLLWQEKLAAHFVGEVPRLVQAA